MEKIKMMDADEMSKVRCNDLLGETTEIITNSDDDNVALTQEEIDFLKQQNIIK